MNFFHLKKQNILNWDEFKEQSHTHTYTHQKFFFSCHWKFCNAVEICGSLDVQKSSEILENSTAFNRTVVSCAQLLRNDTSFRNFNLNKYCWVICPCLLDLFSEWLREGDISSYHNNKEKVQRYLLHCVYYSFMFFIFLHLFYYEASLSYKKYMDTLYKGLEYI